MPRRSRRAKLCVRTWIATAGVVCLAGCGAPNSPSPTPRVDAVLPIALTCPSSIRIDNVTGAFHPVVYTPPTVTGGVPPVNVTCSVASGAAFPLGDTAVACQGTDGIHAAGECHFDVNLVAAIPTLRLTKFMAFGDSITAGEVNSDDDGITCNDSSHPASLWAPQSGFTVFTVQPDLAYPNQLLLLLSARYTGQTFTMWNEGLPRDDTSNFARFTQTLQSHRPEAVLLMQGIIDVAGGVPVSTIVANLDADIAEARRQGVSAVFLSTLNPVVYENRGCFLTNPNIRAANNGIRDLAQRDNVYLVDAYAAVIGRESTLIGPDGLHPTAEGLQVVAQTFFASIKDKLEVVATPAGGRR